MDNQGKHVFERKFNLHLATLGLLLLKMTLLHPETTAHQNNHVHEKAIESSSIEKVSAMGLGDLGCPNSF